MHVSGHTYDECTSWSLGRLRRGGIIAPMMALEAVVISAFLAREP